MMNQETTYTIQEVSEATDLPSSTLRYYEEMGLLEPIGRATNGHRRFSDSDVRRVNLIKKLRRIGMSLEAMRDFLALYRGGSSTARQRREILEVHREAVQAQMDELVQMLGFIDYKIGLYQDEEKEHEREQNYEVSVIGSHGAAGL
jgi:DNA-binding transcriptional MerR regulator